MNSLWLEKKYINLLSPYLNRFIQKSDSEYNFRCPICFDSKRNQYKARGYIFCYKNRMIFKCHNCGEGTSFNNFLKRVSPALYQEYILESLKENNLFDPKPIVETKPISTTPVFKPRLFNLPSINSLEGNHFARLYVTNRKIPKKHWDNLYFVNNFKQFCQDTFPEQFNDKHDMKRGGIEPRLILPFYDEEKNFLGLSARDFRTTSTAKYITIKSHDSARKIYGLERLDYTKKILVLEGPIDSLFLENAVALMDGSLNRIYESLKVQENIHITIVPDNTPRDSNNIRMIKKCIDLGLSVFFWPEQFQQAKDINELVQVHGYTGPEIQYMIDTNSCSDMKAMLALSKWAKV